MTLPYTKTNRGSWLTQLVEHGTLFIWGIEFKSPMLGVELTLKKKKSKNRKTKTNKNLQKHSENKKKFSQVLYYFARAAVPQTGLLIKKVSYCLTVLEATNLR